jgi:hypothetical protein
VRVVEVSKDTTETGAPESVVGIRGFYLVFDSNGFIDKASQSEAMQLVMQSVAVGIGSRDQPVVDLQSRAKKRELEQKHRWEPTPAERQQIVAAALGHPRRVLNVKSAKQPRSKEPVVSFEARSAFEAIRKNVWRPQAHIDRLKEAEILGFKQLVEEHLRTRKEQVPIWRAMLELADEELRVRQVRRTGEGEWYAVVELLHWEEPNTGTVKREWSRRYPTREEALKAVRKLTAEKADQIAENMSLEVRVFSTLEWEETESME